MEKDVDALADDLEDMVEEHVQKIIDIERRRKNVIKIAEATVKLRRRGQASDYGVCPRCGQKGGIEIEKRGGREYIYVYHGKSIGEDGKPKHIRCYIGPVGGYETVQRILGDLGLTNLDEISYGEVVMRAALQYLRHVSRVLEAKYSGRDRERDREFLSIVRGTEDAEEEERKEAERERKRVEELSREIINTVSAVVKIFALTCNEMNEEYREKCMHAVVNAVKEAFS